MRDLRIIGRIAALGDLAQAAGEVIDGRGLHVPPGVSDTRCISAIAG